MKCIRTLSLLLSTALLLSACGEKDTVDYSKMRDITTTELVADMGLGWNLGNTLEACGDWINGSTVSDYETSWGNPVTTKAMIDGIRDDGFDSVRIPVAWSNLMNEDYDISSELMKRVKEVVDWVIADDMYAIIDIHWDCGWITEASTNYDDTLVKYKRIWTQVADAFADYSDYLIFESLNEEGVYDDVWNRYGGGTQEQKEEAYGILNALNQTFVDTIRSSGGNNPKRHLLIAGYATDVALTCEKEFIMPTDKENRCAVSVHYYTPSTFAILEEDADWGKMQSTWGTDADQEELKGYMDMLVETFTSKGIPVIIGEYGTVLKNKDLDSVHNYLSSVCKEAYTRGMCPMLWDNGELYDRSSCEFFDADLLAGLQAVEAAGRS